MEDFFNEKGTLTVSMGRGYISSFEAGVLKEGDIVRTSKIAGETADAFFNGTFLCAGQIVVIDNTFGFRITDMDPSVEDYPVPSNPDDVIEVLPTMIRLAEIKVSLSELKGISYGSIINLGVEYVTDEDSELLAAGMPIARGRMTVNGEYFAIRITSKFRTEFTESNVRTSGFIVDKSTEKIKDYNFTMPDWFTFESMQNLQSIHNLFIKNLKIRRNEFADYEVAVVDQCTFDEAVQALDQEFGLKNTSLVYIEQTSWSRSGEDIQNTQAGRMLRTEKHFLQSRECGRPLSDEAVRFIDSFFDTQTKGIYLERPIFIQMPDNASINELLENENELKYLTSCLRSGWKNFADLNFKSARVYRQPSGPPSYLKSDMVSIVMIRDKNESDNFMYFIYPFFTLEPILRIIS